MTRTKQWATYYRPIWREAMYKAIEEMTQEEWVAYYRTRCTFSQAGTYGHECWGDATKVVVKRLPDGGEYRARRCEKCATIKGGENSGAIRIEPLDAATVTR